MYMLSTWAPIVVTESIIAIFAGSYIVRKVWNAVRPYFNQRESTETRPVVNSEQNYQQEQPAQVLEYNPALVSSSEKIQQLTEIVINRNKANSYDDCNESRDLRQALQTLVDKFDEFHVENCHEQKQVAVKQLFQRCLSKNEEVSKRLKITTSGKYTNEFFFSEYNLALQAVKSAHELKHTLPEKWADSLRPFVREVSGEYKKYFIKRNRFSGSISAK